jgi:hypothetical protein
MVLNDESRAHSTGTLLVRRMPRCRVGASHFLGQQSQSFPASGNAHHANVGMLDSRGHRHLRVVVFGSHLGTVGYVRGVVLRAI